MSEKNSFSPFQIGQGRLSSGLPESPKALRPAGTSQEWERILWSKTAPSLQKPIEEARPFGQRERTPSILKWLRVFWARRWGQRRARRIRHDIAETAGNMTAFMTMGQFAINLAVQSEPRVELQTAKRRELMNRWRNTYERVFSRSIRF